MMATSIQNNVMIKLLSDAKQRLARVGIASYKYDAEALLCHVLEINRIDLYIDDVDISLFNRLRFEKIIQKRAEGVPLQYIIGKTEFYGLPFCVEPGVFIPRPETEILAEAVIRHCDGLKTLDLCTGSGNIAIVLAKYTKCGKIVGTDISEKSVNIARKNASINDVSGRVDFIQADLFKGLKPDGQFDIIVSNPPYIRKADLIILPKEVRYEPVISLEAGEDGRDFYRRIIAESPRFLKEDGILAMEIGDGQAESIKEIFKQADSFISVEFIKDCNSIDRVVTAKRRF